MMRLLIACLSLATTAFAIKPLVEYYDSGQFNVTSRENAILLCQSMNMHIAHEAQLVEDIEDGYTGHAQCGWTWTHGRTVHAHCLEPSEDGLKCMPGRAEVRFCPMDEANDRPYPAGIYCRRHGNDDERPRVIVPDGELKDIYRAQGPGGHDTLMDVNEARAACQADGSKLAYWSHVVGYIERYGIQICHYGWLREKNAVYNANCQDSGIVGWQNRNVSAGYDAICIGHAPRQFIDPCTNNFQFTNFEGIPVSCSDDGSIIIQDRPPCAQEEYNFNRDWDEYKDGFGEIGKGYWLGLDMLSRITKAYKFMLIVNVTSEGGQVYSATYTDFNIGTEADNYRLRADGYSGDAGDMFNELQSNQGVSNGQAFSTPEQERDNDGVTEFNCAVTFSSGWWFQGCQLDNLNGPCSQDDGYRPTIGAFRSWRKVSTNTNGLYSSRMTIKFLRGD